MPRTARRAIGGFCYHVVNRSNGRATLYHDDRDYREFVGLIAAACEQVPMRVLAYCIMPNHFHLVAWPRENPDLGRWMHWLLTTHARHHHDRYGTSGRVWQERYKAFAIQHDHHLLSVLRYVERNPLRANLVELAEQWPWSSLYWCRRRARPGFIATGPIPLPDGWVGRVNEPITEAELQALRLSTKRSRPFGADEWIADTATRLGAESTLRHHGRPRARTRR